MGGARGVSRTEWERRKRQQNGTPIPADLGALERTKDAKVEKIRQSRSKTPEMKRLEENEVRRQFVADWRRLRAEISAGFEERRKQLERQANPPVSDATLGRMSTMAGVYLPKWQRAPGNLVSDSIAFEMQGDQAGLLLAREHAGLLAPGQRSEMIQLVAAALSDHQTDEQRKARNDLRSLDLEKNAFETATAARPIARMNADISPAQPQRVPAAPDAPAPQR